MTTKLSTVLDHVLSYRRRFGLKHRSPQSAPARPEIHPWTGLEPLEERIMLSVPNYLSVPTANAGGDTGAHLSISESGLTTTSTGDIYLAGSDAASYLYLVNRSPTTGAVTSLSTIGHITQSNGGEVLNVQGLTADGQDLLHAMGVDANSLIPSTNVGGTLGASLNLNIVGLTISPQIGANNQQRIFAIDANGTTYTLYEVIRSSTGAVTGLQEVGTAGYITDKTTGEPIMGFESLAADPTSSGTVLYGIGTPANQLAPQTDAGFTGDSFNVSAIAVTPQALSENNQTFFVNAVDPATTTNGEPQYQLYQVTEDPGTPNVQDTVNNGTLTGSEGDLNNVNSLASTSTGQLDTIGIDEGDHDVPQIPVEGDLGGVRDILDIKAGNITPGTSSINTLYAIVANGAFTDLYTITQRGSATDAESVTGMTQLGELEDANGDPIYFVNALANDPHAADTFFVVGSTDPTGRSPMFLYQINALGATPGNPLEAVGQWIVSNGVTSLNNQVTGLAYEENALNQWHFGINGNPPPPAENNYPDTDRILAAVNTPSGNELISIEISELTDPTQASLGYSPLHQEGYYYEVGSLAAPIYGMDIHAEPGYFNDELIGITGAVGSAGREIVSISIGDEYGDAGTGGGLSEIGPADSFLRGLTFGNGLESDGSIGQQNQPFSVRGNSSLATNDQLWTWFYTAAVYAVDPSDAVGTPITSLVFDSQNPLAAPTIDILTNQQLDQWQIRPGKSPAQIVGLAIDSSGTNWFVIDDSLNNTEYLATYNIADAQFNPDTSITPADSYNPDLGEIIQVDVVGALPAGTTIENIAFTRNGELIAWDNSTSTTTQGASGTNQLMVIDRINPGDSSIIVNQSEVTTLVDQVPAGLGSDPLGRFLSIYPIERPEATDGTVDEEGIIPSQLHQEGNLSNTPNGPGASDITGLAVTDVINPANSQPITYAISAAVSTPSVTPTLVPPTVDSLVQITPAAAGQTAEVTDIGDVEQPSLAGVEEGSAGLPGNADPAPMHLTDITSLTSTADGTLIAAAFNASAPYPTGSVPVDQTEFGGDTLNVDFKSEFPAAGPIAATPDGNTIFVVNPFTPPAANALPGYDLWVIYRDPNDYDQIIFSAPLGGWANPLKTKQIGSGNTGTGDGKPIPSITAMAYDATDNDLIILGYTADDPVNEQVFIVPAPSFLGTGTATIAQSAKAINATYLSGNFGMVSTTSDQLVSDVAYLGGTLYGILESAPPAPLIPYDDLITIDPTTGTWNDLGTINYADYTDAGIKVLSKSGTNIQGLEATSLGTLVAIDESPNLGDDRLVQLNLSNLANSYMLNNSNDVDTFFPSTITDNYYPEQPITDYANTGLAPAAGGRVYSMAETGVQVSGDELYSIGDNATVLGVDTKFGVALATYISPLVLDTGEAVTGEAGLTFRPSDGTLFGVVTTLGSQPTVVPQLVEFSNGTGYSAQGDTIIGVGVTTLGQPLLPDYYRWVQYQDSGQTTIYDELFPGEILIAPESNGGGALPTPADLVTIQAIQFTTTDELLAYGILVGGSGEVNLIQINTDDAAHSWIRENDAEDASSEVDPDLVTLSASPNGQFFSIYQNNADDTDQLWVGDPDPLYISPSNQILYSIDPATAQATAIATLMDTSEILQEPVVDIFSSLAFNAAGDLYATIVDLRANDISLLVELDQVDGSFTGNFTAVGDAGGHILLDDTTEVDVNGLVITPDGEFIANDITDHSLIVINPVDTEDSANVTAAGTTTSLEGLIADASGKVYSVNTIFDQLLVATPNVGFFSISSTTAQATELAVLENAGPDISNVYSAAVYGPTGTLYVVRHDPVNGDTLNTLAINDGTATLAPIATTADPLGQIQVNGVATVLTAIAFGIDGSLLGIDTSPGPGLHRIVTVDIAAPADSSVREDDDEATPNDDLEGFAHNPADGRFYSILSTPSDPNDPLGYSELWVSPALLTYNVSYTGPEYVGVSVNAANGVLVGDSGPTGSTLTAHLVTGPADGSLILNLDGSFTYVPTGSFVGVDSFTFRANDGTEDSAITTVTITITPAPHSPVNNVPGTQTVNKNNSLIFTAADGNRISITDPDIGTKTMQVTLTVSNGTISLNQSVLSEVTFLSGTGTNDASEVFQGTLLELNSVLDYVTFNPPHNFSGASSIVMTTSDLGFSPNAPTSTINITVTDNSNPPTLSVISTISGATETLPFTITYATLLAHSNLSDLDGGTLSFLITSVLNGTLTENGVAVTPGTTTLGTGQSLVWTPTALGNPIDAFAVKGYNGSQTSASAIDVPIVVTLPQPAATVLGDDVAIPDGDTTPSASNATLFGPVTQGAAAVIHTFTIGNTGAATLTVGTITLPSGFTLTAAPASSVASGSSTTFTITMPTANIGAFSGNAVIVTNDPDNLHYTFAISGSVLLPAAVVLGDGQTIVDGSTTTSTANGTDFGSAAQGATPTNHSFTFKNNGSTTLTIGAITLPSGFTLSTPPAASLAPGATTTFIIGLSRAVVGTFSGLVSIVNSDVVHNPYTFEVTGVVTAPSASVSGDGQTIPDGSTTTSSANGTVFGYAGPGTATLDRTFTITNKGTAVLTIGTVSVPTGFSLVTAPAVSINPGASTTVVIGLLTKTSGNFSGKVSIGTNDPANNPYTFTISGTVQAVTTLTVTGNGHAIAAGNVTPLTTDGTDSGNVEMPGNTASHSFTLTNAGKVNLVDSVTIAGADPGDFTITTAPAASVAVGGATTLTIKFNPLHLGTRTAQVIIVCNDSAHSVYTFDIQGTGTTDLFDAAFYLQQNPDVAAAVRAGTFTSAYQHFVLYGQYENRAPDPYFSESFYLAHNPDVAAGVQAGTFTSGFEHFVLYGQAENRICDPVFNPTFYLQQNPDVAAAIRAGQFVSGFEHFLLYGQYEDRVFSELFDQNVYLALHPDVAAAVEAGTYTCAFEQFILVGLDSGELFTALFNNAYYLQQNPDVAAAVNEGEFTSGFQHFVEYGVYENRAYSLYFNEAVYLADNPDVAAAVRDGQFTSGLEHYVLYGQFEGRIAV